MSCVKPKIDSVAECLQALLQGVGLSIKMIPKEELLTEPVLAAVTGATANEDMVTATGTFTFQTGSIYNGFIEMSAAEDSVKVEEVSKGKAGNLGTDIMFEGIFTVKPESAGLVHKIKNKKVVIVVDLPTTQALNQWILGTIKFPMTLQEYKITQNSEATEISMKFKASSVFIRWFAGSIPLNTL